VFLNKAAEGIVSTEEKHMYAEKGINVNSTALFHLTL
jgi:hypothetical protein